MINNEKYVKVIINPLERAQPASSGINNLDATFTVNGVYNVESPYTGYGTVTVDVPQSSGTIEPLSVTPTTSAQTITASGGVDGYSPISVAAVTSSIDSNIVAGNIKDGITILGVTGTYTGGTSLPYPYRKLSIVDSVLRTYKAGEVGLDAGGLSYTNVASFALTGFCYGLSYTGNITFDNILTITGDRAFYYGFYNSNITGKLTFNGLETVSGNYAFQYAFANSTVTQGIEFNSLTSVNGINSYQFSHAFDSDDCDIYFNNLETVSTTSGFAYAFQYIKDKTVYLPKLKTVTGTSAFQYSFSADPYTSAAYRTAPYISGLFNSLETATGSNCFRYAFQYNKHIVGDITFSKLSNISGAQVLMYSFSGCSNLTSLSFPALTSSSFGSSNVNQFNNMLQDCTGVTVHFPSNLQSVIGSWTSVTNGFGGTNTTVLFDLTATS